MKCAQKNNYRNKHIHRQIYIYLYNRFDHLFYNLVTLFLCESVPVHTCAVSSYGLPNCINAAGLVLVIFKLSENVLDSTHSLLIPFSLTDSLSFSFSLTYTHSLSLTHTKYNLLADSNLSLINGILSHYSFSRMSEHRPVIIVCKNCQRDFDRTLSVIHLANIMPLSVLC